MALIGRSRPEQGAHAQGGMATALAHAARAMRARWLRPALLSLALCEGCASWRETYVRPEHLVEIEHPDKIGIRLEDGTRMIIHDPAIRGDSLRGWWDDPGISSRDRESAAVVAIPLSDVRETWLKDASRGGTAVLTVTGIIAGTIGLLAIGIAASGGLGM